jgi:spore coat protein U-like protein
MNFRNILIGAVSVAAVAAMAGSASAQAAVASATTAAKIIQPIAIVNAANLNFGTIVRPAAAATIAISAGGVVSGATTVAGITPTAAKFTVSGEGAQTFSIAETATLANGSNTLPLTLTKSGGTNGTLTSQTVGTLSGSLGSSGTMDLVYAASFPITATTATGAYSGTLQVTVNYN